MQGYKKGETTRKGPKRMKGKEGRKGGGTEGDKSQGKLELNKKGRKWRPRKEITARRRNERKKVYGRKETRKD